MREFVRNCRLCDEVMESGPFWLCTACIQEREQVWNFIRKNPFVTIREIAVSTGVEYAKVERMIQYGRERNRSAVNKVQ